MTTLAKSKGRTYEVPGYSNLPVVAADIIYEGAAVGDDGNGNARPLVAGDAFRGFAEVDADNSAGGAGAVTVKVKKEGLIVLPISALAITDVGKAVYASDDDTFTLTAGSNTCIGSVDRWISTGIGLVKFKAADGAVTHLTDSSGGTASDTLPAISGTYTQAEVRNSIASLAAKVNYLLGKQGK